MALKAIKYIFFGNYFIGLLAVALTIEATIQMRIPFNSLSYYILIFCAPIAYYTYAYMGVTKSDQNSNPRVIWYIQHKELLKKTQLLLTSLSIGIFLYLFLRNFYSIIHLPITYWLIVFILLSAAVLYYGLLPSYFFNLNLRNTGWLKPFIIGFIWACTANILPLILLKIERNIEVAGSLLWIWLFIKNWMFCTVNAIMFDIKDYAIDANHELKTFVVRIGIRRTILFILLPLLIIGMCSLFAFAFIQHFPIVQVGCNLIPFILTIMVAFSLQARKNIFYYLIVIDGLIMVKAICGILGMEIVSYLY
jgi:hypothetical protein